LFVCWRAGAQPYAGLLIPLVAIRGPTTRQTSR
jgi:hypothetical protein